MIKEGIYWTLLMKKIYYQIKASTNKDNNEIKKNTEIYQ